MAPPSFTRRRARLALLEAHGLGRNRCRRAKAGALAAARRMGCIQSDPIDVAGRNHDLTLQSRVAGYRPVHLDALLYKDRKLIEYTCKMLSVLPIEAWPAHHWRRKFHEEQDKSFMREHRGEVAKVMKALESGPVSSRELESEKKAHWWGMTKIARIALEKLWMQGRLVIHHREGGAKFYALAEDVLPDEFLHAEPPDRDEARLSMTLSICRASRLASPSRSPEQWWFVGRKSASVRNDLEALVKGGELFKLDVEGCKPPLYAPEEDAGVWADAPEPYESSVRFLAPLDPLLWNRKLFGELHGHDYVWEVYKRPRERKYGYYCLPIVFNGDYVGLIEPFMRKKDRALEIRSLHIYDGAIRRSAAFREAFSDELEVFAEYCGADGVEDLTAGKRLARLTR
jgi:hypothetical protein